MCTGAPPHGIAGLAEEDRTYRPWWWRDVVFRYSKSLEFGPPVLRFKWSPPFVRPEQSWLMYRRKALNHSAVSGSSGNQSNSSNGLMLKTNDKYNDSKHASNSSILKVCGIDFYIPTFYIPNSIPKVYRSLSWDVTTFPNEVLISMKTGMEVISNISPSPTVVI